MLSFLLSFIFVILVATYLVFFQTAGLIGAMYLMDKYLGDKWGTTDYDGVDPQSLDQHAFVKVLGRILPTIGAATGSLLLILFALRYFLIVNRSQQSASYAWQTLILFVLHAAAVAAGLHFTFKLEPRKTAVLTAAVVLVFIVLYWSPIVPANVLQG